MKTAENQAALSAAYTLLGVNETNTLEEIKKAYKKLSLKHHPDKGGDLEFFKKLEPALGLVIFDSALRYCKGKNLYQRLGISENADIEALKQAYDQFPSEYKNVSLLEEWFLKAIPKAIEQSCQNKNYYQILGVEKTATNEQIQAAYNKLSILGIATAVDKAYKSLSDVEKRKIYDAHLLYRDLVPLRIPEATQDNKVKNSPLDFSEPNKTAHQVNKRGSPLDRVDLFPQHTGATRSPLDRVDLPPQHTGATRSPLDKWKTQTSFTAPNTNTRTSPLASDPPYVKTR